MSVAERLKAAPDPMALVRALRKIQKAGFDVRINSERLQVAPAEKLTDEQRAFLREHKPGLVALLQDADTLAALLEHAGWSGLSWREGTPPEWDDDYLLAVDEVLYGAGRMVNRLGRRYATAVAPPRPDYPDAANVLEIAPTSNVMPLDREAYEERAAIMEYDGGLPRDEAEKKALALSIRAAELQAAGWSPWNAKARAENEMAFDWETSA